MNTQQNTQYTVTGNVEHFTISDVTRENPDFRRVLWTGKYAQIVAMTIPVGGEIGDEVHETTDQILTFVSGTGTADLAGHSHDIGVGDQCAVPAGTQHNFRNTGDEPLVLYTVYSPPEHAPDGVYATKEEADTAEAAGLDEPPAGEPI
ncbi:MAG: cupin domain-containing protein [Nocardioides sp.]|nr:cupin domain-containing protein [Nocardioides sp.]